MSSITINKNKAITFQAEESYGYHQVKESHPQNRKSKLKSTHSLPHLSSSPAQVLQKGPAATPQSL